MVTRSEPRYVEPLPRLDIPEQARCRLTVDQPKFGLRAGDIGRVLRAESGGTIFMVDFGLDVGETIDGHLVLLSDEIEPLSEPAPAARP